jgi:hypothetical protein
VRRRNSLRLGLFLFFLAFLELGHVAPFTPPRPATAPIERVTAPVVGLGFALAPVVPHTVCALARLVMSNLEPLGPSFFSFRFLLFMSFSFCLLFVLFCFVYFSVFFSCPFC